MKADIHPVWYEEAKVTCACGNSFVVGATVDQISVDVCYNCHPFYTGKMKYVDTAGRVDAFRERQKKANVKVVKKSEKRRLKKEKRIREELEKPDTLSELRSSKVKKVPKVSKVSKA